MADESESTSTDKREDNPLWLAMWKNQQTDEFHQSVTNPLLTEFWHSQNLKKGSRVLVPLCGKSLDMLWLASQGHKVIGVELSPVAVKAFFAENGLKAKKRRIGNFTCWQSGDIVIWCGDFFSLHKHQLGRIDCVFDRAALTALPTTARGHYVAKLRQLIGEETCVFLLTIEDIVEGSGESGSHVDSGLTALYAAYFEIVLTHSKETHSPLDGADEGEFNTYHKVYQLRQRPLTNPPE